MGDLVVPFPLFSGSSGFCFKKQESLDTNKSGGKRQALRRRHSEGGVESEVLPRFLRRRGPARATAAALHALRNPPAGEGHDRPAGASASHFRAGVSIPSYLRGERWRVYVLDAEDR